MRIDRNATADVAAIDNSSFGGALTLGGRWDLGSSDDLRYQRTVGSGFSRYIGLGIAGHVAWRHLFTPTLRSNLMHARSQYDNNTALTGTGVTKNVQSWRANFFHSPYPKLDIGAELMFGQREIESGLDSDLTRLQFTTRYSF